MPQFRMQHRRGGKTGAATLIKVIALFLVLFLLLFLGIFWLRNLPAPGVTWQPAGPEERFFLPETDSLIRLKHYPAFTLAYSPGDPEPVWAACEWDARMEGEGPASFFDSSFFNMDSVMRQRWKEWGEKGKQAARRLGRLFTVGGPLVEGGFFLVWLDEGTEALEGVGLIFPDQPPYEPDAVSIDSVETLSGLDLFAGYWLDSLEVLVEQRLNPSHWATEIPANPYFTPEIHH